MFRDAVLGRVSRRRSLAEPAGAGRRPLRVGAGLDLHPQPAVLREHHDGDDAGARYHRRPRAGAARRQHHHRSHLAGRIDQEGQPRRQVPDGSRRAAERLQLLRRAARQPRGDDARHLRQRAAAQSAGAGHRRRLDRPSARRRGDDDLRRRDEIQGRGHAAARHRRQGIRIGIVARLGGEGHAAARRHGGDRRELRAHPPQQSRRHGRAAAAVPAGR